MRSGLPALSDAREAREIRGGCTAFGVWAVVLALVACAAPAPRAAAPVPPLWEDPDRQLFRGPPGKYYSGKYTDIVDQVALRSSSSALALDVRGEARNINALDEVPDSSWFTNRIGRYPMTPEQVAIGPCTVPPLDPAQRWTVLSSKSDGVSPGFVIRGPDDRRYLLKFDDVDQGPKSTAADAIVSRLYYAVGYGTPCNRVVFFERSRLDVAPDALDTDWLGHSRPYTASALDEALARVPRTRDGRYRALASLWLEGKSLGPWRFEATRADDPNDIVEHEDRRELRGLRLLAAWTGHGDQREQNTLSNWISAGNGLGWIRHNLLDFGDCLGNLASPPMLARRLAGHAYGVDFGQIVADLLTFGVISRPFEEERFGPTGAVFSYFSAERFDPEQWRPSYPNPAFERMTERDAAWMARILARFEPAQVERAIRSGRLGTPQLRDELLSVLLGRRERILRRYLPPLSSLSEPVAVRDAAGARICAEDLGVLAGIARASETRYTAMAIEKGALEPLVVRGQGARSCVVLPPLVQYQQPESLLVEWRAERSGGAQEGRLRLRVHRQEQADVIVRVERAP